MARSRTSARLAAAAGYSLIEMMIAMGLMTVVMGATLGSLSDVVKGNDAVVSVTTLNDSLRSGMDLMVRDLLQVGSGLPPGHNVTIPHGDGAVRLRLPGPRDRPSRRRRTPRRFPPSSRGRAVGRR